MALDKLNTVIIKLAANKQHKKFRISEKLQKILYFRNVKNYREKITDQFVKLNKIVNRNNKEDGRKIQEEFSEEIIGEYRNLKSDEVYDRK